MPRASKANAPDLVLRGSQFYSITISPSTSSSAFAIAPAFFTRTTTVAAAFEFFRFTRLVWSMLPSVVSTTAAQPSGAVNQVCCAAYYPEQTDVTATTISVADCSENEGCSCNVATSVSTNAAPFVGTVGTTCHVPGKAPKRVLLGVPVRWYITSSTSEDKNVQQGALIVATGATLSSAETGFVNLLFSYTCEFKGRSTAGLSLAVRERREREDEKDDSSHTSYGIVADSMPEVGVLCETSRGTLSLKPAVPVRCTPPATRRP